MQFEKQHGDRKGIDDVISSKKRFQYEEQVHKDPFMYDSWFDYLKLEETQAASDGLARWVDRWPVSVDECAGRRRVGKSGWGGGMLG